MPRCVLYIPCNVRTGEQPGRAQLAPINLGCTVAGLLFFLSERIFIAAKSSSSSSSLVEKVKGWSEGKISLGERGLVDQSSAGGFCLRWNENFREGRWHC